MGKTGEQRWNETPTEMGTAFGIVLFVWLVKNEGVANSFRRNRFGWGTQTVGSRNSGIVPTLLSQLPIGETKAKSVLAGLSASIVA